jgi:hypothetical protein
MTDEREVRKETDFWGNEREVVYENDKRVGEITTEERGGIFGFFSEPVKVERDNDGKEVSYTKNEERGGFFGFGAQETQVRYDPDDREIGQSRVEERGGFLGHFTHHVRIERDNAGEEVSQTHTERRGTFFGFGGDRRRVTTFSPPRTGVQNNKETYGSSGGGSGGSFGEAGSGLAGFVGLLFAFLIVAFILAPSTTPKNSSVGSQPARLSEPSPPARPKKYPHIIQKKYKVPAGEGIRITVTKECYLDIYGRNVKKIIYETENRIDYVSLSPNRHGTVYLINYTPVDGQCYETLIDLIDQGLAGREFGNVMQNMLYYPM